jgi:type IX secretion system PorP/SprF family membrane protein
MKTLSIFLKNRSWGLGLLFLVVLNFEAMGQTRKFTSQFSHFQSYFNPGLTGYEGSTVRGFVRNQWAGMEGAPKTYFVSAEVDFGEMAGLEDPALMGKNAIALSILSESNGAFRENEAIVSYASRIRLSESHNLRLGAGVIHQSVRMDGNALSWEDQNDPAYSGYLGQFSDMQVIDFNVGLAITHKKYYFSYGVHRINGGQLTKGDRFIDAYPAEKMIQFGVRESLSDRISLSINGFYRSRKDLPEILELNVKALLMNKVWIGAGQRVGYATNFSVGFLTDKMRLGYLYEMPVQNSYLLPGGTHEITAIVQLFRSYSPKRQREILIW